uniref:Uncharacterized protein n=1 Tax=Rhizophora mucronata TaxID=61149 RepID=A0A2P2PP70_RHIMU
MNPETYCAIGVHHAIVNKNDAISSIH